MLCSIFDTASLLFVDYSFGRRRPRALLRGLEPLAQARNLSLRFDEATAVVDDLVDAEARRDARGALRERERGRRLVVGVLGRRSGRDDHSSRAASKRVLQQPRQQRISIRNVASAPMGFRRQIRERRDTIS